MILIDPPSGWLYDFPKPYTKKSEQSLENWLVENGYPANLAKEVANNEIWCRFIGTEQSFSEEDLEMMRES